MNPRAFRIARLQNDLTQAELAKRLGVKRGAVSNWESKWASPKEATLDRLVKILGPNIRSGVQASDIGEAPSAVAQWLKKSREGRQLTLAQLAEKSGLGIATIYNIESGRTRSPNPKTIHALESALKISLDADSRLQLQHETTIEGLGEFTDFDPHEKGDWPGKPGVYVFYDKSERPVYVGRSQNIGERLPGHEEKFWFRRPIVEAASFVTIPDKKLRQQVETLLIRFLKSNAVLNVQGVQREEEPE